ncbi:CCNB1IP1 (predicted) [Pycnogonum litorale]
MEGDLICNFKRCRRKLSGMAWVTACSHIFCNEDGEREFSKQFTCPACRTSLPGENEILRVDLSPSEQYKSMILAGQKPDVILEICTRALSFWTYQIHQEQVFQEYVNCRFKEKIKQMEVTFSEKTRILNVENNKLLLEIETFKSELENQRKCAHEVLEKFQEKSRKYQKLQSMYETLRRKCISSTMIRAKSHCTMDSSTASNVSLATNNNRTSSFGLITATDILKTMQTCGEKSRNANDQDFQLVLDSCAEDQMEQNQPPF